MNELYRVLMAILGSIGFGLWQENIMAGLFVLIVCFGGVLFVCYARRK